MGVCICLVFRSHGGGGGGGENWTVYLSPPRWNLPFQWKKCQGLREATFPRATKLGNISSTMFVSLENSTKLMFLLTITRFN